VDSGIGLVTKLKAKGNTAPIYVLSSIGDQLSQSVPAANLGVIGIIQKPIDNKVLLTMVKAKLPAK